MTYEWEGIQFEGHVILNEVKNLIEFSAMFRCAQHDYTVNEVSLHFIVIVSEANYLIENRCESRRDASLRSA